MEQETRRIYATFIGLGKYKKCIRENSWAETFVKEVERVGIGCKIQRGKGNERTSARKRRVCPFLARFKVSNFYVIILTRIAPFMDKYPVFELQYPYRISIY